MRLIISIFTVVLLGCGMHPLRGQQAEQGQQAVQEPLSGSVASRVDSLLALAKSYRLKGDREGNLNAIASARRLAESAGDKSRMTLVFAELSRQHLYDESFDEAKACADSALLSARESAAPRAEAAAWLALSVYYNYLNVRDLAVENAQKALAILDEHEDPYLRARLYYTLYGVYSSWNDIGLSNKYAHLCIDWSQKAGDKDLLSNAYAARSVVMEMKYREADNEVYLDSMLASLQRSAGLFHEFPGEVSNTTYSIANVNIANYYYQYRGLQHADVRDSVSRYALIAKQSVKDQDFNFQIRGSVSGLLSELAIAAGDLEGAEAYLLDSYRQMSGAAAPSYYALQQTAEGLSRLYERQGDFERALWFRKKREEFSNEVFDRQQIRQSHSLEAAFKNKELTQQMAIVEERARSRRVQNFLYAGISLLALASLILLYHSYRAKSRIHAEQRLGMEKEALADALQIERKNSLLLQLKDQLSGMNGQQASGAIDKLIRNELRNEATLQRSAKEFREIRPDFFRKLKEISDDKLTPLDLKYCAYIHLKLSVKEIAAIFHVEPKSIRVRKYRMKQKLGLSREQDLDGFLQELV